MSATIRRPGAPGTKRGGGRPRKPRGGPCAYCGRRVPREARCSLYCSDSRAALAGRARRKADPVARERVAKPPLTPYLAKLLAVTGGRL